MASPDRETPVLDDADPRPRGWQHHSSPVHATLHSGLFIDASHGWIVSHDSGLVLRTMDGGATWQRAAELGEGFFEMLAFTSALHGFVVGDRGRVLSTTDGGTTWRQAAPFPEEIAFYSVLMFSPAHGFAGGVETLQGRGQLWETRDGGTSWTDRSADIEGLGFTDALITLDHGHAIAGGMGAVYRTTDSGRSWQTIKLDTRSPVRGLAAIDSDHLWAVGGKGLIMHSSDGGESWSTLEPFTSTLLRSVAFIDRNRGFAVGDRNSDGISLWTTHDGGTSWHGSREVEGELHRLLLGAGRLWAIGEGGLIVSWTLRALAGASSR
jgi:photosystem II stability/assembly factor-like uncharacterized protein